MGIVGVIIGTGVTAAVTIGTTVYQSNKMDEAAKRAETQAKNSSSISAKKNIANAMAAAAAGTTELRINKKVYEKESERLDKGTTTNYVIAKEDAREAVKKTASTRAVQFNGRPVA